MTIRTTTIDGEEYVLVHADGGACHGTPLAAGQCPACGLYPDMQSTEFWLPAKAKGAAQPLPPPVRYPVEQDRYGIFWIKGKHHNVWIEKRPDYCDRGHWLAHCDRAPSADVRTFTIDESDKWPRYYMDFDRMVAEIRDWLEWREGDGPRTAGDRAFSS